MVNGWSDKIDDAKFEVYWSNYPLVHVGDPIIGFIHFDYFAWAAWVHGQQVV